MGFFRSLKEIFSAINCEVRRILFSSLRVSGTGIRPRCRSFSARTLFLPITPTIGTLIRPSIASLIISRCFTLATLFKTIPAILSFLSKFKNPYTRAAMEPPDLPASMTKIIGALRIFAVWAVLPKSNFPDTPSNRPMTPSITATSACEEAWLNLSMTPFVPIIHISKLYDRLSQTTE